MFQFVSSPAGWDNDKKINILYENMQSMKPEDDYSDVILRPPTRKTAPNREAEVHAEDEQTFLSRLLLQLQQQQPQPPVGGAGAGLGVGVNGAAVNSASPLTMAAANANAMSPSNTPIRGTGVAGLQKPVDRRTSSSTIPNQVGSPNKVFMCMLTWPLCFFLVLFFPATSFISGLFFHRFML